MTAVPLFTSTRSGALLLFCAAAALGIANSPWANTYHRLWAMPIAVVTGGHTLSLTLHQWINDRAHVVLP